MAFSNQLTRILDRLDRLPAPIRMWLFSYAFGRMVPYVGTSGVRILSVEKGEAIAIIPNRRKIRNHVGGVHAAAVALIAETTSGVLVGRNVTDEALPLIKTMNLKFIKRNQGDFRAVARLTQEQIESLQTTTKGEIVVPVELTDATGGEPVVCEMVWAWVPKKRDKQRETR